MTDNSVAVDERALMSRALDIMGTLWSRDYSSRSYYANFGAAQQSVGLMAAKKSINQGISQAMILSITTGQPLQEPDRIWYYVAYDIVKAVDSFREVNQCAPRKKN